MSHEIHSVSECSSCLVTDHIKNATADDDVDEDSWAEQMRDRDVVQFLSSMRIKNNKQGRVRSSDNDCSLEDFRDDRSLLAHGATACPVDSEQRDFDLTNGTIDDNSIVELDRLVSSIDPQRNNIQKFSSSIAGNMLCSFKHSSTTTAILEELQDMEAKIIRPMLEEATNFKTIHQIGIHSDPIDDMEDHCSVIIQNEITCLEPTRPEHMLCALLCERQWETARDHLRLSSHEAKQLVPPSKMIQDKNFISFYDDTDGMYPLYLACSLRPLPPTSLIDELLKTYPAAARYRQKSGYLPIHAASDLRPELYEQSTVDFGVNEECIRRPYSESSNHREVLKLLLLEYPESIGAQETDRGMTPLHIAASTIKAENGIVSPVESQVFDLLLSYTRSANNNNSSGLIELRDHFGRTALDWAWENVDYFCAYCGKTNSECVPIEETLQCYCKKHVSVTGKCLHPLLRTQVFRRLSEHRVPDRVQQQGLMMEAGQDDNELLELSTSSKQMMRRNTHHRCAARPRENRTDSHNTILGSSFDDLHSSKDRNRYDDTNPPLKPQDLLYSEKLSSSSDSDDELQLQVVDNIFLVDRKRAHGRMSFSI